MRSALADAPPEVCGLCYNSGVTRSDDLQTVRAAARIVTDAMLQAGMEPAKAIDHPVVRGIVQRWVSGEWTRDEVVDACRDLLMMYPMLRCD